MGTSVLVVDDDPVVRMLMSECLGAHGFDVTAVSGAAECFQSLKGKLPDLLVVDFLMPEMNGLALLKNLKDNPGTTNIPVMMLSAHSNAEAMTDMPGPKPEHFLQKPFAVQDIVGAVRKALVK